MIYAHMLSGLEELESIALMEQCIQLRQENEKLKELVKNSQKDRDDNSHLHHLLARNEVEIKKLKKENFLLLEKYIEAKEDLNLSHQGAQMAIDLLNEYSGAKEDESQDEEDSKSGCYYNCRCNSSINCS